MSERTSSKNPIGAFVEGFIHAGEAHGKDEYVCFWHQTDMPGRPDDVCSRG
jgi:hypothetical protein